MTRRRPPASLVAERAARLLRDSRSEVDSVTLLRQVLSTRASDEATATRILESAFAGDPRLTYDGAWRCTTTPLEAARDRPAGPPEPDRVLVLIDGSRPDSKSPFRLRAVAGVRLRDDTVVAACGGEPTTGKHGESLREELLEVLDDAVPILHDPPGARAALERWLEEPLDSPISLREVARQRLRLAAGHDLGTLAAALRLSWRDTGEWEDRAEVMDACLEALRREGESLRDLRAAIAVPAPPVPWERYAFDRSFLRTIPRVAGTYRFFGTEGELLYVGKAKNLHARVSSYFAEGRRRTARVQKLLDGLHRIECEPLQSDLEAVLREAAEIRRRQPSGNVQQRIHVRGHHRARMRSIMILEPAAPPFLLRAYLIRDGRLAGKVGIGPRGGGLRKIERVLEDAFFSIPDGPTEPPGPDVDIELIGRWLAENRDRVVVFDPTTLRTSREVVTRLRGLLGGNDLFDPDGSPVVIR